MPPITRKPIAHYCKQNVSGWDVLPYKIFGFPPSEEKYFCSFFNKDEGIQIICDVRSEFIHVSLAPVPSTTIFTREQIEQNILKKAFEILREFFGDLKFIRMPDDERKRSIKHFFHYLTTPTPFSNN